MGKNKNGTHAKVLITIMQKIVRNKTPCQGDAKIRGNSRTSFKGQSETKEQNPKY